MQFSESSALSTDGACLHRSVDCPVGRDPHDEQGVDEVQVVTCTHTSGAFTLRSGRTVSAAISVDDGRDAIEQALVDFGTLRFLAGVFVRLLGAVLRSRNRW